MPDAIPESPAVMAVADSPSQQRRWLLTTLQDLLAEWRGLSEDHVQVTSIEGGITNILWKVEVLHGHQQPAAVVVRVFGDNTDLVVDREAERWTVPKLNEAGFGAQVLGTFQNGRVEQFVNRQPLEPHSMGRLAVAGAVARLLASFHRLQLPRPKQPQLWSTISRWLQHLEAAGTMGDGKDAPEGGAGGPALGQMVQEVEVTQQLCAETGSPVVFCHNDLLAGNLLVDPEVDLESLGGSSSDLLLIDFEYSGYSYRGFDWGNHFNEHAGFECNWSMLPSEKQQEHFLGCYLEAATGSPPGPLELRRALAEASAFMQASHIFWGVWALIQAAHSSIDFDYRAYSQLRWQRYFHQRDAVVAQVHAAWPRRHDDGCVDT